MSKLNPKPHKILIKVIYIIFFINYLSVFAQSTEDYYKSGLYKLLIDNRESAVEDFNKAIELNPNDSNFYLYRGIAYNDFLDSYKLLKKDLNKVIELNPNSSNAYLSMGIISSINHKDYYNKEAIIYLNKAIELNPKNIYAYYYKGLTKYLFEDYRGAKEDFTKAINLNLKFYDAYIYRANIKQTRLFDYSGAMQDYNKLVEINPNSKSYDYRAEFKFFIDDYKGAIEDINKAIKLEPNNPELYIDRGLYKLKLKQLNSACLDFSKAGELGWEGAYSYIKDYCN